jgi:hypothetical protein
MAQIYNMISIIAFSLAGVCLIFAVFCWTKFNMLKIISDLSGRTAKKSIEQMRAGNEKSGSKSYRPTPIATNRGTLTEPIEQNTKPGKGKRKAKGPPYPKNEADEVVTELLKKDNYTELLNYGSGGTELLDTGTELLTQTAEQVKQPVQFEVFEIVQSIVLTHTDEVI